MKRAAQIVNEGVNFLRQYVGPERCLKGERQTLEAVLKDLYPANEKLDDAFRSHLDKLEPGSFVMQFGPDLSLGCVVSLHFVVSSSGCLAVRNELTQVGSYVLHKAVLSSQCTCPCGRLL